LWDLATYTTGQTGAPQAVPPTYMIAMLPGKNEPEFLLTIPFTPRNKTNLIGLMAARCDGAHLGEIVVLDLPKQEIIPGPAQIESLINQDQNISKDLTLWNQQGSQVLRSQILTLPIDQTFLFVAPIYIQAVNAKMPQLKKVALAVGNSLVYADTYEQALANLAALQAGQAPAAGASANRSVGNECRAVFRIVLGINRNAGFKRSARRGDQGASQSLSGAVRARQVGRGRQGTRNDRSSRQEIGVAK
jgi:hypothetical protein